MATRTLTLPSGSATRFPLEPFSQHCLLEGVDELGYLLAREPEIAAYEARRAGSVGGGDSGAGAGSGMSS